MRDQYSISELCSALGVSRSGYHAARQRPPSARAEQDRRLLDAVRDIHAHRHTRCYGSPRMTDELRRLGLACSPNRVARIMRQAGIRVRPRRAFRPRTTRQDPAAKPAPNLLKDTAAPTAPGQQLVSDITYIPTREGWLYLVVVIDLYSRAILGWKTAASLHTDMVLAAITQAMASGWILPGAIFHSDRGCQYSAAATRQLLQHFDLRQSMSAKGYCYDNAFAESAGAFLVHAVTDPAGKACEQKPADFPSPVAESVDKRVGGQTDDGVANCADKVRSEARLPLLIPFGGGFYVDQRGRGDVSAPIHSPKRTSRRASAPLHGRHFSGCFSMSSRRASRNAFSSSVKGSSSSSQPPLSISASFTRISYRSSFESLDSPASISALLVGDGSKVDFSPVQK